MNRSAAFFLPLNYIPMYRLVAYWVDNTDDEHLRKRLTARMLRVTPFLHSTRQESSPFTGCALRRIRTFALPVL